MNDLTGRDLIVYIMENHLENIAVFSPEFLKGFKTIEQVAVEFNVGVATVGVWFHQGILNGFNINGKIYILPQSLKQFKKMRGVYKETKHV